MPLDDALTLIQADKDAIRTEITEIEAKIRDISTRWYADLVTLKILLTDFLEETSAYSHFGQTEYTFVVKGWIPKKFLPATKRPSWRVLESRLSFMNSPMIHHGMMMLRSSSITHSGQNPSSSS